MLGLKLNHVSKRGHLCRQDMSNHGLGCVENVNPFFNDDGFQLPSWFRCRGMGEKANEFLCFLKMHAAGKALSVFVHDIGFDIALVLVGRQKPI